MSALRASRRPPVLAITDHALLRWMERAHGVDVEMWRRLCQEEAEYALSDFAGASATRGPAFVVSPDGRVITFVGAGLCLRRAIGDAVAISVPTPAAA